MDLSPLKLEQKFDLYLINGCGEGCLIFYRKRNAGKESSRTWNKKEVQTIILSWLHEKWQCSVCFLWFVYFISCSGLKPIFNRWIFLAGGDSFRLSILYQLKVFLVNTCPNHVLWRVHPILVLKNCHGNTEAKTKENSVSLSVMSCDGENLWPNSGCGDFIAMWSLA